MRKLSVYLFALLAVAVTMTSCNKDDDPVGPPTLNFIGGEGYVDTDATINVNTIFKVGIAASSNAETNEKLTSLKLTRSIDGTAFIDTTFSISENTFNIDFQFNAQQDGVVETIAFLLTDKAGQTATKSLVITYEAEGLNVTKHEGITMGSFNDDAGSFYSTMNNTVYNITDATANQEKIDFLFYLGATNASTIASPEDAQAGTVYPAIVDWTTKNATYFMETEMTAADFDAIGDTYIFPEMTELLSDVNNLENNDVIMFMTVDNKYGFIKVNSINGRGDFISLDVIISE